MVLADSHRIPRAPCYHGNTPTRHQPGSAYRALTHYGPPSQTVQLPNATHAPPRQKREHTRPTTPHTQPLPSLTRTRFHHHPLSLATTHGISSPTGTEMFHFPASPLAPYTTSDTSDTPQRVPGLPIRTPSDHSPSAGSPRLIAGHHVLHRPLMPRHPPNAQINTHNTPRAHAHHAHTTEHTTQHNEQTILASTIQFTTNPPTPPAHPHPTKARPHRKPDHTGAQPQTPTACHPIPATRTRQAPRTRTHARTRTGSLHHTTLPRKEVIQPHLPVRLPCYDFVPITSPTFDRSP